MDDTTHNFLQQLLDMSKAHTQDIASLQAINVVYHQIILDLLHRTDVLENLQPEVKDSIIASLASANQMIEHATNREKFDSLVEMVHQKIAK